MNEIILMICQFLFHEGQTESAGHDLDQSFVLLSYYLVGMIGSIRLCVL